ncbi:MAG TPA: TetR/AcrR family transcriptional regulator [Flavitalea sp.]|nr:TetR/AcrR family transcriptional regulator [Flavitalea sp.]
MGIKERKERDREDTRLLILDAAKKLFTSQGYEATTIRKIAAEIEYSPTTIYLYYKDKNEILYALHREGFLLLSRQFQALAHVDSSFERLKAMGRTYIRFAVENRDFYELMFIMKEPLLNLNTACGSPQDWEEGVESFDFLLQTVEGCQQEGYFKGQDPRLLSMWIWSTVHGLCALQMHGHLDHVSRHQLNEMADQDIINQVFESFVRSLEQFR